MGNKSYKWRKIGTLVIDMSIISMFYQLAARGLDYFVSFNFTSIIHDLIIVVLFILTYIIVAIAFQMFSYRLVGNSFGHAILDVRVYNKDNSKLTMKEAFMRESYKFYMLYATLGIYVIYNAYLVLIKNEESMHDKRFNTKVV